MDVSRRSFIQLVGGSVLVASPMAQAFDAEIFRSNYTGKLPINQHMTNETSAQFSVLTYGKMPYVYKVFDERDSEIPVTIWDSEKRKNYPWGIDKLIVHNLKSKEKYRLRIIDKNDGSIIDERFFRNLQIATKKSLRFALISCSCDFFHYQNKHIWSHLFDNRPDMIFHIGDTCYADLASDGSDFDLWRRYCETRRTLSHFRQSNLVPTLAVWDDHDFGHNNANKYFRSKKLTRRLFHLFFGSKDIKGFKNTVGVGSVFTGFGQRFFFMDGRSYRDEPFAHKGMMWGDPQQENLLDMLSQSSEPSWIFSGSQFFSGYKHEESFQNHFFNNLVDFTRKLSKISAPVAFGSGDVHFSEIMGVEPRVLGYKTYEFTSSSMHSFNFPHTVFYRNPRRERSTWRQNFTLIKSTAKDHGLDLSSFAVGIFGKNLFYHEGSIRR